MSTRPFLEVESKFAVEETIDIPDLTSIQHVDHLKETVSHSLSAIYYDTADLRLTRAKITLRRRSGGKDDGWHIKFPSAEGRLEIHAELGEPVDGVYQVPQEIKEQVLSLIRREPLTPIAQVDNERTEYLLADSADHAIAEFCDDKVTAFSFLPGGKQRSWREWEIELSDAQASDIDNQALLRSATALFIGAGAKASHSPSKLLFALGESINNVQPAHASRQLDQSSPAAGVIQALSANRDKLISYDPKVRRDEWDSIHQMRVATRELRSHLQTFEGILVGERIHYLEEELKLLASLLGVARDAEVVEKRFHTLLEQEDSDAIDDNVRRHVREDMSREYRRAHRRVVAVLNSDRYLDMLDALDELVHCPPLAEDSPASSAEESPGDSSENSEEVGDHQEDTLTAEETLLLHLDKAYRKLRRRHELVTATRNDHSIPLKEREVHLHDMRKAAKRLRYSAEAVGAATGLKTKKLSQACKRMQSLLGDFQDAVTAREILLKKAHRARKKGEDTFGYGLLYQRERYNGLEALKDYDKVAEDIRQAHQKLSRNTKKKRKKQTRKGGKK
ncbi:CHAD domain-containing protein [Corynebacterium poyangense]|uniref:CHAD domain-containing protein n=1 Tax=Corynebacterium poyangense TaxID=2684405 RepID=A0A7H0SPY8_9CORY|nr:CYTH and CHAD domain-containing protein [Corynebacterium poyangense]MBZ8178461.1 CHAD domain-containing protein [Corynebacterium poyangense]QNQ90613.1 CHAD domain-containing protein [Corynebacterium poyangense]